MFCLRGGGDAGRLGMHCLKVVMMWFESSGNDNILASFIIYQFLTIL